MSPASPRAAIITELEETRTAFHELLSALPPAAWNQPSRNPTWTVAQIMVHIVQVGGNIPPEVNWIRRGRWFPKPPARLFDTINAWAVRLIARGKTPGDVATAYDQAHTKLLMLVNNLAHDDWAKNTTYPTLTDGPAGADGIVTLEMLIRYHARHFQLHVPDVAPFVVTSEQPGEPT
ncbi:DinB family protein [Chloroflexota bacterium]